MKVLSPVGLEQPLSGARFGELQRLARQLGRAAYTARRRRLLFLGLAAPGFVTVFSTPLHQNLLVLLVGLLTFAAACGFRARTEPLFRHAEAAALWPPSPPSECRDA